MDKDWELNLEEICRCCKRAEHEMISIFDENVLPISVKEMLHSIAVINVHENDGLPSLVCTPCLNKIQDTYIFILHLILANTQLEQIVIEQQKQADAIPSVPRGTYDTNQCMSIEPVELVERENESAPVQAGGTFVENCQTSKDESLSKAVHSDSSFQFIDEEQSNSVPKLFCDICKNTFTSTAGFEHHKIVYCLTSEPPLTAITITRDDTQLNQRNDNLETYEDIYDIGDINDSANQDQDSCAAENVNEPNEENNEIPIKLRLGQRRPTSNFPDTFHHAPVEGQETSPTISLPLQELEDPEKMTIPYACNGNQILRENDDDLSIVQAGEDFEDFEDSEEDKDYTPCGNRKEARRRSGCNTEKSLKSTVKVKVTRNAERNQINVDEDKPMNDLTDDDKVEEICQKSQANRRKTTSKLAIHKCELCEYVCANIWMLRYHLASHSKVKPFECSKCNNTYGRRDTMLRHSRTCNGEFSRNGLNRTTQYKRNLALQDLKDDLKIKKFYTVSKSDESKLSVFKCQLCTYTTERMRNLRLHLQAHFIDTRFQCSKCNVSFSQKKNMLLHWRRCNGKKITENVQDLQDPLEMKKYYTAAEIGVQSIGDDDVEVQGAKDRADKEGVEEICPTEANLRKTTTKLTMFKCELCGLMFAYMSILKRHLATHFNVKPFECSKCNNTYVRRDAMMCHWRRCKGKIRKYERNLILDSSRSERSFENKKVLNCE